MMAALSTMPRLDHLRLLENGHLVAVGEGLDQVKCLEVAGVQRFPVDPAWVLRCCSRELEWEADAERFAHQRWIVSACRHSSASD